MGGFFSKAKPQLVSEENFSKFRSALAEAARGKEFNELITKGSRFYDLISSHAEFYIDTYARLQEVETIAGCGEDDAKKLKLRLLISADLVAALLEQAGDVITDISPSE